MLGGGGPPLFFFPPPGGGGLVCFAHTRRNIRRVCGCPRCHERRCRPTHSVNVSTIYPVCVERSGKMRGSRATAGRRSRVWPGSGGFQAAVIKPVLVTSVRVERAGKGGGEPCLPALMIVCPNPRKLQLRIRRHRCFGAWARRKLASHLLSAVYPLQMPMAAFRSLADPDDR